MVDQNDAATAPEIPPHSGEIRRDYLDSARRIGSAELKSRLLTLEGLDGRTGAYRETQRLIAEIESDLGGAEHLSAMERQMVQHGAVLGAIATDLEARHLKGQRIDIPQLCLILNAQRRAFDAIGYRRRSRDVTPTLESFLTQIKEPE